MERYGAASYVNTINMLRKEKPHYIVKDKFLNIELIEVPVSDIKIHYKPEERAQEIYQNPQDKLEELAREFISILKDSGIPLQYIGITGSLLLKIHNITISDIDVLVYSRKYSTQALDVIEEEFNKRTIDIPRQFLEEWVKEIVRTYPCLDYNIAARIIMRRKHRVVYRNRVFSINFVRVEEEVKEKYGDYIYRSVRPVRVKARVVDSSESIFLPGVYYVEDVKPIDDLCVPKITQVVTFEGLYSGIAKEGEEVVVYGMLEEVVSVHTGETYYRIVIGSASLKSMDYILPLNIID